MRTQQEQKRREDKEKQKEMEKKWEEKWQQKQQIQGKLPLHKRLLAKLENKLMSPET